MATAEQYAAWLVQNKDKAGTPEFETVAAAYKQVRGAPAAVAVGEELLSVPRQLGLTARYAAKGVAALPAMAADAVTGLYNTGANLIQGEGQGYRFKQQLPALDAALTRMGLPEPATPNERVVGDAATAMAGAGSMAGAAGAAGIKALAARPDVQIAGAATGAAAGGSVREAGGNWWQQFLASLAGGVAGGALTAKIPAPSAAGIKAAVSGEANQATLAEADKRIAQALQQNGIDWAQVPERIRQSMRAEAAKALDSGAAGINPDAARRLLAFQATGTTPTVGMLTQNPATITAEQNLARAGANSTDQSLHGLAATTNTNTTKLLGGLDSLAGRKVGSMDAGQAIVGSLQAKIDAAQARTSALYSAARDTQGRSAALDGAAFTKQASALLDENLLGYALPASVQARLNQIAKGEVPFTVDYAEQLKTVMGNLARSEGGATAKALGLVRKALDDAPLQPAPKVNPGNLPAVQGTVPPSPAALGSESIDAFNAARSAHRSLMQRIENNPALRAVHEGVEPDQFVNKFIIGNGASAKDVRALAAELPTEAREATKQYLVNYLRSKATNGTEDIAKFSSHAYEKALQGLADKLPAFFSREEIQQLRYIGEAGRYMQAQPAGSAVNNSNSGALLIGRGLDALQSMTGKLPFGLNDSLGGMFQGYQQRQALSPANALGQMLAPIERQSPLKALALGSSAAGVITPEDNGEDNRRKQRAK
jgi:hypothetical protein